MLKYSNINFFYIFTTASKPVSHYRKAQKLTNQHKNEKQQQAASFCDSCTLGLTGTNSL
jgi:hypothetical protein